MSRPLSIHEAAEAETNEAADFYDLDFALARKNQN